MTLTHLRLTSALREQMARVERARALYPNEDETIAPLHAEQRALAQLLVTTLKRQQRALVARHARLPEKATRMQAATLRTRQRVVRGA